MFMEDVLAKLVQIGYVFSTRDRKFVISVARRSERGHALTTRQGWALLNVLRNNKDLHKELGMKREALAEYISKPTWRMPLVPSVELRNEVRHLGDNLLGFRGSRSDTDIEFAAMKAVYSNGMKIVSIDNVASLEAVVTFIGKWGFGMDTATEKYLADCYECLKVPTQIAIDGDNIVIDAPNQVMVGQFALHILGADFV